jgi:hypothetical protein
VRQLREDDAITQARQRIEEATAVVNTPGLTAEQKRQAIAIAERRSDECDVLIAEIEINREARLARIQAAAAPTPKRVFGFWGGRKTGRKRRSIHSRPSRKRRG